MQCNKCYILSLCLIAIPHHSCIYRMFCAYLSFISILAAKTSYILPFLYSFGTIAIWTCFMFLPALQLLPRPAIFNYFFKGGGGLLACGAESYSPRKYTTLTGKLLISYTKYIFHFRYNVIYYNSFPEAIICDILNENI